MKFSLWRTVAARILLALIAVSFASIGISVLSLARQARGALIENIEKRNLEIARQGAREISHYVQDSISQLGMLASILGPLPYEPWVRSTVLRNLDMENKRFRWMVIVGQNGQIQADGRPAASAGAGLDPATTAAVLADQRVVSPVRIGPDYTPYMIVSMPLRLPGGERGWLVADLYLRDIWNLVDAIAVGGKQVAYLVSGSGELIAHMDKVRVINSGKYDPIPAPPVGLPPDRNWRIEKEHGVDAYLTAYAKVDGIDWDVAVQQPIQEAFLPVSLIVRWSLILIAIGFVISAVPGFFLSRAISAPLVHLLEGTQVIAAGDLTYRIPPRGGDEVRRLAQSFNGMVESLQQRGRELAESERQYRLMTERVNDIIFTLDESGVVTFVSPRLRDVTGYTPADLRGVPILDLIPEDARERYRSIVNELLSSRERVSREVQVDLKAADGRRMLLEVHATAEEGPEGKRQIYGVARDVSERARLVEQLNSAQKMEAIGRLAGGVAHDFNNLLTAIIGYCDFSLLDMEDTDTVRKNLEEIRRAGGRATALTQQLLAFSRRQALQPKVLELNRLVANVEKLLQRLLGEDIALETRLSPVTVNILADPGQIEQVIMNICINARDAMPHGGRITIEIDRVVMDATRRGAKDTVMRGDFVRLRITDTGTGMDAETRSHLFEPFFTTKEVGKGTGLGLSIVYGIVRQSSGFIWVESEPGQGTTFEIYIPRCDPRREVEIPVTRAGPAAAAGTQPGPGEGETVLLVEDEMVIRSLVKNVLEGNGYAVLEAEDGERALELYRARSRSVDIVDTDVVLPGVGGREVVDRIRGERPDIPALYMSGYARDMIDGHGTIGEAAPFLQKPFPPEELLRRVRELLDARKAG